GGLPTVGQLARYAARSLPEDRDRRGTGRHAEEDSEVGGVGARIRTTGRGDELPRASHAGTRREELPRPENRACEPAATAGNRSGPLNPTSPLRVESPATPEPPASSRRRPLPRAAFFVRGTNFRIQPKFLL